MASGREAYRRAQRAVCGADLALYISHVVSRSMSLQQVEEEEYEVGSPTMFWHAPWSCMSSLSPEFEPRDDKEHVYECYTECGKTALFIGGRVLIDEAP